MKRERSFMNTFHGLTAQSLLTKSTRCGTEMDAYLQAYEALFLKYGVDLFMAGHNHMYGMRFTLPDPSHVIFIITIIVCVYVRYILLLCYYY